VKKTDLKAIKELTIKDLSVKAEVFRKELADLSLAVLDKTNKGKDVKLAFKKRKDLAQVLTVMRQKELVAGLESRAEQLTSELANQEEEKPKTKRVRKEKTS